MRMRPMLITGNLRDQGSSGIPLSPFNGLRFATQRFVFSCNSPLAMLDRRKFLRLSAISSAAALVGRSFAAHRSPFATPAANRHTDRLFHMGFRKGGQRRRMGNFEGNGSALDAVEAGARVPEADPTNQSVGLGEGRTATGTSPWMPASWMLLGAADQWLHWNTSCTRFPWRAW